MGPIKREGKRKKGMEKVENSNDAHQQFLQMHQNRTIIKQFFTYDHT